MRFYQIRIERTEQDEETTRYFKAYKSAKAAFDELIEELGQTHNEVEVHEYLANDLTAEAYDRNDGLTFETYAHLEEIITED